MKIAKKNGIGEYKPEYRLWDGEKMQYNSFFRSFFLRKIKNHLLTSWTGCKDINGVKIYEGDFYCVFDDGEKSFIAVIGDIRDIFTYNLPLYYTHGSSYSDYTGEVIGNIFENPELEELVGEC